MTLTSGDRLSATSGTEGPNGAVVVAGTFPLYFPYPSLGREEEARWLKPAKARRSCTSIRTPGRTGPASRRTIAPRPERPRVPSPGRPREAVPGRLADRLAAVSTSRRRE